jgi:hypothetical protein
MANLNVMGGFEPPLKVGAESVFWLLLLAMGDTIFISPSRTLSAGESASFLFLFL